MFSTEVNHLFQQFDNPIFFGLMVFISVLGTAPLILSFVSAVAFAVDFKKGLIVINIVAWTAIITHVGKQTVNYPRPIDIDPHLTTVYYTSSNNNLTDSQPTGFFESFSTSLLSQTRNDEFIRYGFPSGHASVQMALWMTLFFLFRNRWVLIIGVVIVLCTVFSRIYLAHHFLGDALGGVIIGSIVSGLLLFLLKRTNYLAVTHQQFVSLSILWLPALLLPFITHLPIWIVGSLIGFNAASILLIQYKNFPVFHILPIRRFMATLISTGIFILTLFVNKMFLAFDSKLIELLVVSALSFLAIGGSFLLCQKLNLIRFRF